MQLFSAVRLVRFELLQHAQHFSERDTAGRWRVQLPRPFLDAGLAVGTAGVPQEPVAQAVVRLAADGVAVTLENNPPQTFVCAGDDAYRLYFPAGAKGRLVRASTDFWDDQDDVYSVRLRPGERLYVSLAPKTSNDVVLALWQPSTVSVTDLARQDLRIRLSNRPGRQERLAYTAAQEGWYHLQVRLTAPTVDPVSLGIDVRSMSLSQARS